MTQAWPDVVKQSPVDQSCRILCRGLGYGAAWGAILGSVFIVILDGGAGSLPVTTTSSGPSFTSSRSLLRGNPVSAAIDVGGLARGVAAAFIGVELYDGVDPAGAEHALSALEQLSVLVEVVEDLGPLSRRALRNRMRRSSASTP